MSEIVKVGNAEVDKANYDYFSLLYSKMPKEYVVADLVSKCEDYNRLFSSYQDLEGKLKQKENIIKEIKSQLDYLETYSSKEDVFEDMKRRLNNIEEIIKENK